MNFRSLQKQPTRNSILKIRNCQPEAIFFSKVWKHFWLYKLGDGGKGGLLLTPSE